MPIVNIQITREGTLPEYTRVTREQKAKLIEDVSKRLFDVLNKPMNSTFVVIDEVEGTGRSSGRGIPKANGRLGPSSQYDQTPEHSEGMSTRLIVWMFRLSANLRPNSLRKRVRA